MILGVVKKSQGVEHLSELNHPSLVTTTCPYLESHNLPSANVSCSSVGIAFRMRNCYSMSNSMADTRISAAIAIIALSLDRLLVWEALQAAGATIDSTEGRHLPQGNKSLAGIGDRVIALVVTDRSRDDGCKIGNKRPAPTNFSVNLSDGMTGETNDRLKEIGGNNRLESLCDAIGLTPLINASPGARFIAGTTKSATVEAIVSAAYKHGGIACAVEVMRNLNII